MTVTTNVLVGTDSGLYRLRRGEGPEGEWPGERVTALASGDDGSWVALVDGRDVRVARSEGPWEPVARLDSPEGTCMAAAGDELLVGTREAHLASVSRRSGSVEAVKPFDTAEGRDTWYTPWGGPPDTRSISVSAHGPVYVNVHVGGILRGDGLDRWVPTIDVDADVHQVLVADPAGTTVLAATAYGLARSHDAGATWRFSTAGLHADYSRAVAVAGEWLLLSASTGPSTRRAAVYRRPLDAPDDEPFIRCAHGLPEWFPSNVNTGCLAADGATAVIGTREGDVFVSHDGGASWHPVADGLPPISCLMLADGS